MGMLVDGVWHGDADHSMQEGTYRREMSALPSRLDSDVLRRLQAGLGNIVLVASASCPWSHGAVLTRQLKGLDETVDLQIAGGPRVQGYALTSPGSLAKLGYEHAHQLYSTTDPAYTGRATVPVLWDAEARAVLSNASVDIMRAFDTAGGGPDLFSAELEDELDAFLTWMFDGLSNAVYRAGKAQRQDEYDDATSSVYATLHALEDRLTEQPYLFGDALTAADVRLFATLVRYDTVYATYFRCTRYRLSDFPALWRFTRRFYQMPGVAETVDFDEIRRGYYLNDGSHNPYGLVADQPEIDWMDRSDL